MAHGWKAAPPTARPGATPRRQGSGFRSDQFGRWLLGVVGVFPSRQRPEDVVAVGGGRRGFIWITGLYRWGPESRVVAPGARRPRRRQSARSGSRAWAGRTHRAPCAGRRPSEAEVSPACSGWGVGRLGWSKSGSIWRHRTIRASPVRPAAQSCSGSYQLNEHFRARVPAKFLAQKSPTPRISAAGRRLY